MKDFNLQKGLTGSARITVTEAQTAMAFGSGKVRVYGTPAMVGLMEKAAIEAVDHKLPQGYVSVGTKIDVKHTAPTPVGMHVTANAELLDTDGPKLKFRVEAYDGNEKIGEGLHDRFIIRLEDLNKRAETKLK